MKKFSKIVSKDFMMDLLTPFLPYMKDQDVMTNLTIVENKGVFTIEYFVEEGGAIIN